MNSTAPVSPAQSLTDLPAPVRQVLCEFLEALQGVVGANLRCVLLFGSAAEGRLRPTSDVNLLVVASALDEAELAALRTPLRAGRAAAGLAVMFLESGEFDDACESFAMKFADMKARHRLLFGQNPFAHADISRAAEIRRLRQVLLNLKLRLRERYALDADQPERIASALADMTGPIRVAAATVLALRDGVARQPKAALQEFAADSRWGACLEGLSVVHRGEPVTGDRLRSLVADVWALLAVLGAAAAALSPSG